MLPLATKLRPVFVPCLLSLLPALVSAGGALRQAPQAPPPAPVTVIAGSPAGSPAGPGPSPSPLNANLEGAEVAKSLRTRIAEDSKRIGHVAENLLSVQTDINHVEKEVLGKVFDIQTLKTFFTTHQAVVNENDKLKSETSELNREIETLSGQLNEAQTQTAQAEKDFKATSAEQSAKISEDAAVIEGLNKEMIHSKTVERDNEKLKDINRMLREQNTKTIDQAQLVHSELNNAKASLHDGMQATQRLQDQLVDQHRYGTECHAKVTELEKSLKSETAKLKQQSVAAAAAAQQAQAQEIAKQKRLTDENEVLKAQLTQAAQASAALQQKVMTTNNQIATLQAQSSEQIAQMKGEMGKMRAHVLVVRDSLMQNIKARKMVEERLAHTLAQIEYLQNQMRSGGFAALELENTQLKADLSMTAEALKKSHIEEATARGQAEQAMAAEKSLEEAAQLNAKAAQAAAEDAASKVAKAQHAATEQLQLANDKAMNAEANVAQKCKNIWNEQHSGLLKQLEQCKTVRIDVKSAHAQIDSLRTSLKSGEVTEN